MTPEYSIRSISLSGDIKLYSVRRRRRGSILALRAPCSSPSLHKAKIDREGRSRTLQSDADHDGFVSALALLLSLALRFTEANRTRGAEAWLALGCEDGVEISLVDACRA
ncbi:hypothetical protein BV25DRAFT_639227 [Artomyces pyxidatus]|uniref:Uncharacterized protein n=1 Tax=Artomyces pyxidatus TaxID=48021 RepID=A0ACB8T1D8_9AGAM|nr:hypothetical protein BV25DRAFT_639227 [Artomyces pyxidatus]